jgi:protein SCO1/2
MRAVRITLWLLVAIALFGLGALAVQRYAGGAQTGQSAGAGTPFGGPFELVDQSGAPVTEAIFRGKPAAVLFGYTHCPDVCPTTLMQMAEWRKALGSDAEKMHFVFVTVDPERDTVPVMRDYVGAFSDKITGVTGEPDKVAAMTKAFKIYSRKVPLEGGDYSMDHTASVLLLGADGDLAGTIARDEDRETAMAKLKRLVAG